MIDAERFARGDRFHAGIGERGRRAGDRGRVGGASEANLGRQNLGRAEADRRDAELRSRERGEGSV